MSAITFELPITSLPDIPLRDGTPFRGFFKAGKMHVTVDEKTNTEPLAAGKRTQAALEYIDAVRMAMSMPSDEEAKADPRYDYLYKKHVLCIPSDEIFADQ